MSKGRRAQAFLAVAAVAGTLFAAVVDSPARELTDTTGPEDPLGPLGVLVGSWSGEIEGRLGSGKGVRRYQRAMSGRFLLCRHTSVRLPQEKSPGGDQHEELGVFSFDRERKRISYREFMIEGIVVLSTCEIEGATVVCTSESVENGPGIRARLTLEITDRYRFTERYELAWPGKDLELYFTNRWTRTPVLEGGD